MSNLQHRRVYIIELCLSTACRGGPFILRTNKEHELFILPGSIYLMRQPLQSLLPCKESDPAPRLGSAAEQQSRQSRRGQASLGPPESSCNAQGIWCDFPRAEGKRMSESKEGARSPQRSERVPGGVRESKWAWLQYTGLYSLSSLPPSFSLVVFVGCPLWLVPKHLKAKSSTALLACHTNWNRKWLSAPGTITTLFSNDKKSPKNKKKITLKRISRTTRGWCLSDDCRDGCWLSARLAEGWHQYKGTWIFSDQVNEADSTWHV